jgi:hypothetical protein
MENAQALAETATLGPKLEGARVLLLKVYTPSRFAPETSQAQRHKNGYDCH